MTGKEQARLLGLLFWLLTGFQIFVVGLIGIFYIFFFGVFFSTLPQGKDAPPPEFVIPMIIFVVAFILIITLLMSIPKVVAGYGLRKEKSWARIWSIIACVMAVMNVPFGTAVGVYGLVFIFGDAGKAYFDNPSYGKLSGAYSGNLQAPPPSSWQQ